MKPKRSNLNPISLLLVLIHFILINFSVADSIVSPSSLMAEATRELSQVQSTYYQHNTDVNEATGRFNFDCSGFLDYAIERVSEEAYREIPLSSSFLNRPVARDFYSLFTRSGSVTPDGSVASPHWMSVQRAMDLQPGDVISWLTPSDSLSHNTGHVMIVRLEPEPDVSNKRLILVSIIDSTQNLHDRDSRLPGTSGLGTGTVGIEVDANGLPLAYRWKAKASRRIEFTQIAFGRLK